ncbi:MAG: hypothetical protein A2X86_11860 [Bdellovibrionales bacterium GWA2_49_15]|nr:MAG: hypothetical protein A2X86_11860 [Bdellovibrionales bacterium GWA2_49_15]HAZ12553.1 HAD family hydrolase [Bdellovibrionales bacterium]
MKYDSLIFDLDGTLWDTCSACALAWNKVLERNMIEFRQIVPDDIRKVAGKSHHECISEVFKGLDSQTLAVLSEQTAVEDNLLIRKLGGTIYRGVKNGLEKLGRCYPIFIVSNCQDGYIETFLEFSGFHPYFKDYESWGRTGKRKSENLKTISARNGLKAPVYIGDTMGDYTSAKEAGIPFIHVSYGFGQVPHVPSFDTFTGLTDSLLTASM